MHFSEFKKTEKKILAHQVLEKNSCLTDIQVKYQVPYPKKRFFFFPKLCPKFTFWWAVFFPTQNIEDVIRNIIKSISWHLVEIIW